MKKMLILLAVVAALLLSSCSKHVHKVGSGAQGKGEVDARQWYILFGLVPLNTVDTNQLAGDAKDYEITTETGGLDILMNIVTGYVTIGSRTVTVKK